jgi:4-hydroxyphenylacetate 3-monooxygenase
VTPQSSIGAAARTGQGGQPPRTAPMTGNEYRASLRDAREVWLDGKRVDDVTEHPAFRNAVHSIARLYDELHEPTAGDVLTCPTESHPSARTLRTFRVARSSEDLVATQQAIAHWARMTYGWMGRTPDYKASLTNTFGGNPDYYGPFAENARAWYQRAQARVPFLSHALANPPIDRHRPVEETRDVCVHVVGETDEGIVVSGAKVVATSAAITNYCFIGQTPATASDDPDLAVAFILPIDTDGVRIVCRASYELAAWRQGSPFDYPLSSRFDENDAIVILDRVLVPWENVLMHRDPVRVRSFFPESGFLNAFLFHGCTRLAVKLDFLSGLLARALRATGGDAARGKRALLGEAIAWSNNFWSLSHAMARVPEPWHDGAVLPNRDAALAYCVLAPDAYPRVKDIIERSVASGLIYLPSSAAELENPATAPLLARYVRGSHGMDHVERIKVMKLLWDAVGSEFGGRHELYERNYAGGWECIRLMVAGDAQRTGRARAMDDLVDRCLAEYDESGWTDGPWTHGSWNEATATGETAVPRLEVP